jgi:hypothetical protein
MKMVLESGESWEQYRVMMLFLTALDKIVQGQREASRRLFNDLLTTLEHMGRYELLLLSQCLDHAREHGWLDDVDEPQRMPYGRRSPMLPPPYVIDVRGNEDNPILSIRSQHSRGAGDSLRQPRDARLLYWLGMVQTREPFCLTKAMVCAITRGTTALSDSEITRCADMDMQSWKRRLARSGIHPHALLTTVRGCGWSLHPSVRLGRGFRSVFPYIRGGNYRSRDLLDNLPASGLGEDDEP